MLGRSVAFGVKSAEKHLIRQKFFELTTPNADAFSFWSKKSSFQRAKNANMIRIDKGLLFEFIY